MSKVKSIVILTVLAILIAFFGVASFVTFPVGKFDYKSIFGAISKGIDLEGGYYAVLTPAEGESASAEDIDAVIETLRKRLDDNGYTEATIERQDSGLRVEIPNVDDPDSLMKLIGDQGELQFRDSNGDVKLTGDHIRNAQAWYDEDNKPIVLLEFTNEGSDLFAAATKAIADKENGVDNKLSIYLGDTLVSSPTVEKQIVSTTAEITGIGDYDTAKTMASVIKSGSLRVQFKISESKPISASMGENVLGKAIIAAGVGLLIIFVIMMFMYRGMGGAASIALMIYVLLYVGILAIFPGVQLTFPGIAGIILSIGMAVDANVLIFERIKDEYAVGKTVTAAIKSGFKRAVVTVLDSNITTVIAAICLFLFSNGSIKGFSITLLLGIVVSMFTAVLVSRGLIALFRPLSKHQDKFFNLVREEGNENA